VKKENLHRKNKEIQEWREGEKLHWDMNFSGSEVIIFQSK